MKKRIVALAVALALAPDVVVARNEAPLPGFNIPQIKLIKDDVEMKGELDKYQAAIVHLEGDQKNDEHEDLIEDIEDKEEKFKEVNGLPLFSALGGPAYTPEQGIILAVGGLYSFKTDRYQEDLQRSSISGFLVTNYGNKELGYGIRSKYNIFWNHDDVQFSGNVFVGNMGVDYWGVGYENGEKQKRNDDTSYDALIADYDGQFNFRIKDDWFIGPVLRLSYFSPNEDPLTGTNDSNYQKFKDKPLAIGLGAAIQYDSRDVVVNAWKGQFFRAQLMAFHESWNSDSNFDLLSVDYRTYQTFSLGRTLAFRGQYHQAFGDIPYYEMPSIGGPISMRGIYNGQYRDKVSAELTFEYRHTFRDETGRLSNHGMTVWSGVGAVGNKSSDLMGNGLLSYGVGYRYQLQPRMNLRIDLGMSKNGGAFYFNFTEAF